ncbi:MAG: DUF4252 domain-containing protein [Acidobacteria bacterium]|nr:DUF4252 domain-containing protein [Acidobacteriota bacterium]
MFVPKKLLTALTFLILVFAFTAPTVSAKGDHYEAIVKHLKTKYQAKKVKIPFIWVARFAVKVVRPAGVKSFSITMFENLQFSRATLDEEMQSAMRNSLSADWSPILRVRSREGEQVYMYMREEGNSVKIMLVTIDKNQAAVIRAKFNPEKLADFVNNPKIFGISLNDNKQQVSNKTLQTKEDSTAEEKIKEPKKD